MSYLFKDEIYDWSSWAKVFQSIEAFDPLVRYILKQENIYSEQIEHCKPGTNAVFKIGKYVIKIFAPRESGISTSEDFNTEVFGLKRAEELDINAPRIIAKGLVNDKFMFRYMIMDFIVGQTLSDARDSLDFERKLIIGQRLRSITDKMNTSCYAFNSIDIISRELSNKRWSVFPKSFNDERRTYLKELVIKDEVYVHGDLNPDNVLVDENNDVYIIDFADALLAPCEYELPAIICDLFRFDKAFMKSYFGELNTEKITELCLKGLLIHDFGVNIIQDNLGGIDRIHDIQTLRDKLHKAICFNHNSKRGQ